MNKGTITIILSILLLSFTSIGHSTNIPSKIIQYCQDEWSDTDDILVDMCYDIQFDSFAMYSHYYYGKHIIPQLPALTKGDYENIPEETRVTLNCFNELRMPEYEMPDWKLLVNCCEDGIAELEPALACDSKFDLDDSSYFDRYIKEMKSNPDFLVEWNGPDYDTYDWSQHLEVFNEQKTKS